MAALLAYSPLISAAGSILMLVIWGIYLELFWRSYRRQHRAKIIIAHGEGMGVDSLCLISNMGAQPIHIEGVIVTAEHQGQRWATAITSVADAEEGSGPRKPSREGPLKSGDYLVLGTFRELLELTKRTTPDATERLSLLDAIQVWVLADLASESDLVVASRRFLIHSRNRGIVFRPEELETRRVRRVRERREIEEILRLRLEEAAERSPAPRDRATADSPSS